MNDPYSSGSPFSGGSLLDKSTAKCPANIDMSIFDKKKPSGPLGQGTTSSDYLQKCHEDNPEPDQNAKAKSKVMLSNCKFETPADQLVVSEPFEMSCEVKGTGADVPTKLRVTFRLFVTYQDENGATVKDDLKAYWDGFMAAKTESQTVKAKGTLYCPDVELGTKLQYQLVAEHMECPDKAESSVVDVVAKINVWVQAVKLAHFRDGGIVPQVDAEGMFPVMLASAIDHANQKNHLGAAATVVIQGFSAKGSGDADDVELAAMRARMVKALMSRDQGASEWAALAKQYGTPEDVDQILSSLRSSYGWSIDSDNTHERMRHFQEECNMRFGLGLKEDGILGPKTWGAVHRVLVSLIQEEIGEDPMDAPKWTVPNWSGATKGTFGWGAHAPEDSGENAVEICLVYGKNPGIVEPPKGEKPAVKHNVIQNKEAVTKKPLEASQKPKALKPQSGPVIEVALFFDGTDNNRDRDRPLGHDSNVSKLYDLFNHDDKTRYKYYFEGVATGNWKESDFVTGGLCGRGIAERIARATERLHEVTQKHPGAEIRLSLFGFSRGAGTVLAFINHLFRTTPGMANPLAPAGLSPFPMKSMNPLTAGPAPSKPTFDKIWFVGIFDAVGSIGVPGDADEGDHDLSIKGTRIRSLAHLVSRDERRGLFPLTSVRRGPGNPLPSGWSEIVFPGVHSDVGGGYENIVHTQNLPSSAPGSDHTSVANQIHTNKRDDLSRVACWAMFDAAAKARVPMHTIQQTAALPQEVVFSRLMEGKIVPGETSENGWTTFFQTDGSDRSVTQTLGRLSIHPSLLHLWEARQSEMGVRRLIEHSHPDYLYNIAPFTHDSLGFKDPNGIRVHAGLVSKPRTILYRGT